MHERKLPLSESIQPTESARKIPVSKDVGRLDLSAGSLHRDVEHIEVFIEFTSPCSTPLRMHPRAVSKTLVPSHFEM